MGKNQAKQLRIAKAEIHRLAPAREAAPGAPVQNQEPIQLSMEVQNPGDSSLFVWTSRRAYDYDASTHVLTLYLTEQTPPLPPGIVMISNHPRTPKQVEVGANSSATINVSVPAVMRRRVPGEGLGMSFVEEPIDQIDQVDLHIQYASKPIQPAAEEIPSAHQERLETHGNVMQTTIKPVSRKEK